MKKSNLWSLIAVLLIVILAISACAKTPTATPTVAPTVTEPEPVVEPTVSEPAAPEEAPVTSEAAPGTEASAVVEQPADEVAAAEIDCMDAKAGDTVSMLYQWSGAEEEKFSAVLAPFVEACGVTITPESSRDQALLDTRVKAGTPPDLAFWQTPQLIQYKDQLIPMTDLGINEANYAENWRALGTVDGKWLGLPAKADIKTLIWYSPKQFKDAGYSVPTTWEELDALVEKMVADGKVPWSMGFESGDATGWTGTDFIQDILLVQQGPEYVNGLIDGSIKYNDPGVKAAYETYGKWAKDAKYTVGGAQGTLSTGFNDAILKVFADTPEAMMVKQSGFAMLTILGTYPNLVYGTDFDFFGVPDAKGLQGGSDWMMAFSDKPAVKALVAYLSSAKGGEEWAKASFDLTPNLTGVKAYVDETLLKKAEILAGATAFTPDIGDSIPGGFGKAEFTGVTDYVNGSDLDKVLETVAAAQAEAFTE